MPTKLILLLCLLSLRGVAQMQEGVIAVAGKNNVLIVHEVQEGETLETVAKLYHTPPDVVADANGLDERVGLEGKTTLMVPVGAYNHLLTRPAGGSGVKPLLYQVAAGDDLFRISWRANVSPNKLKEWNSLKDKGVKPGTYLLIGWVSYDAAQAPVRVATEDTPHPHVRMPAADTGRRAHARPPAGETAEGLYLKQIQDGGNLVTERGTAAFFHMPVKTGSDIFYGFHNTAPKGTIVKVVNTGTHAVAYVKILGPIPNTKQYHNALIGISDRAKRQLGVRDARAWCELSYTGY